MGWAEIVGTLATPFSARGLRSTPAELRRCGRRCSPSTTIG
jgi:hypothetical protein